MLENHNLLFQRFLDQRLDSFGSRWTTFQRAMRQDRVVMLPPLLDQGREHEDASQRILQTRDEVQDSEVFFCSLFKNHCQHRFRLKSATALAKTLVLLLELLVPLYLNNTHPILHLTPAIVSDLCNSNGFGRLGYGLALLDQTVCLTLLTDNLFRTV